MSKENHIKIFLASSEELVDDRIEFEKLIYRKTKLWKDKNLFLELIIWEDFLDSISSTRKQDDYNKAIEECDIFVLLFFTKVGKYTEEEFDTAYKQFKSTSKPLIFTYFKSAPIDSDEIDERVLSMVSFKRRLAELEHFYSKYKAIDSLKLHFSQQLDILEQEKFFKKEDDLPPIDDPLPADLILEMMPKIRVCIEKVMLIANCKEIHDLLHELRQHAIRPLREEVLSQWEQEGMLSSSREKEISNCMKRAYGPIRLIDNKRESLDPEILAKHKYLCRGVDRVKGYYETWDNELTSSQSEMSVGEFTESVDLFAEAVQDAFSEADRSMAKEESKLGELYEKLLQDLRRTRKQSNLSPSEHPRLDSELEKVKANRKRVKNSLTIHHRWQEIHDKLHELDAFRGTSEFDKKLEYFCMSWMTKLFDLVNEELDHADAREASSVGTKAEGVAATVQQGSPKSSQDSPPACSFFYDDLQRLRKRLETLRKEKGTDAFDEMRKPFDDAFYCIDKKTLIEAKRAKKRAVELRVWLDELAERHRQAD